MTEIELEKIRAHINNDKTKEMRALLRAISGKARYNIMVALNCSKEGLAVSELAKLFGFSVSRVSHQLRILRKHQLVNMKRNGKSMIYTAAPCPHGSCDTCAIQFKCPSGSYKRQATGE